MRVPPAASPTARWSWWPSTSSPGGTLCRAHRSGRPMSPAALVAAAPHPRRGPGRGAGGAAAPGRRRGGRAGHRGHGGPPRPPHPLGALDRRPLTPFGVYVHVPFCRERCDYCAFATYTDRDHLMERYADACVRELQQAFGAGRPRPGHLRLLRRGHPVPPPPRHPVPHPRRHPARAGRRGHRRVQSRGRRRRAPRRPTGAPASPASPSACSPPTAHVLAGLGRRHVPARRRDHRRRRARGRVRHLEPRPHLRRRHRDATTTGPPRSTTCWRCDHPPPHLSAYGLTVEPGTPLAADPRRAIPTTTSRPRRYEHAEAVLTAAGYALGGDLQLGPARPRVPAQPPLLGAGRLRGHRLGRPLAPRRHALVERAHARALHRRRRGRALARGRPRGADARSSGSSRRCRSRCARPAACPGTASSDPRSSTASSSAIDGRAVLTVRGRLLANEVSARIRSGILHR